MLVLRNSSSFGMTHDGSYTWEEYTWKYQLHKSTAEYLQNYLQDSSAVLFTEPFPFCVRNSQTVTFYELYWNPRVRAHSDAFEARSKHF